ncbi:hypothetical protein GJ744_010241 [Endocarpon pusillum]|uniref:Uncharacterized protein n=1 Tax=Endocarpon pusillum TaxID=364733 RepID=A0A8H7E4C2_9EURO|nr:hypothetical protein GJ744_010241 [Endocarpon pusillum]
MDSGSQCFRSDGDEVEGDDVEAEDYITTAIVNSWYDDNRMYPDWDSSEIQKFSQSTLNQLHHPIPAHDHRQQVRLLLNDEAPGMNTGVVAGGIVGGVVCLFSIAGLAFFLMRHRQRRSPVSHSMRPLPEIHSDDAGARELPADEQPSHLHPLQEVDGGYDGVEAPSSHSQLVDLSGR